MVDSSRAWFRDLYFSIIEYRGHRLFDEALVPWIDAAQRAVELFSCFRKPSAWDHKDGAQLNAMWNLYALGRVNDILLMGFQNEIFRTWTRPSVTPFEYAEFFTQLGFSVVERHNFSPLHHEIVQVHQSSGDNDPIGIGSHAWPGLMLGDLMFSRSGVEVIGGRNRIIKEIAENSTLYFTFRRLHRKTTDLSVGWGSNSQWRTAYRRDYETNGKWIYNADGSNMLNLAPTEEDRNGLASDERLELCRNRCFITTAKEDDDLWPYDDRFEEGMTG